MKAKAVRKNLGFLDATKLICVFCLLIITGCKNEAWQTKLFTKLPQQETGIHFNNLLTENEYFNAISYSYFYNGAGVSTGDINNDGLVDILFTGNMVSNKLYLNKGNFTFEDITVKSGIGNIEGWCTGVNMVDINNDGWLDIYVCRSADANPKNRRNLLFINHGNLSFSEEAKKYGLDDEGYSTQAAFFDYDKDGDLDMFLINHSLQEYAGAALENLNLRSHTNPDYGCKLYENNDSIFTDISQRAGIISNVLTFGLGVAISDFNKDGWPDIYVSNDYNEPDYYFLNNCNGTFSNLLDKCFDQISLFSMGSDAADYDNNGYTDLVTLDMLPEDNKMQKMHSGAENFNKFQMLFNNGFFYQYSRNMLHKNNGDGTFSEIGQFAGISNTDWSWSSLFSDFDNDGYKDLFITNGYVKDFTNMDFIKYTVDNRQRLLGMNKDQSMKEILKKMPSIKLSNYVFKNNHLGQFENKISEWGLDEKVISSGASYADLDNDGDLDLIVNNTNDNAAIYRNNANLLTKNNFLKIQFNGTFKNKYGIGSKVTLYCKDSIFFQEQFPVRGYQSSVDLTLNFGIAANTKIDSILVVWPDDKFQKIYKLAANQKVTLNNSEAQGKWNYSNNSGAPPFFSQEVQLPFNHTENDYNDFNTQFLLTNFLSREGPCMTVADINGDNLEDIFIGGAKIQQSVLLTQNKRGNFSKTYQPSISSDSLSEDVSAAFFDADNDGDQDLYVCSGGYEFSQSDTLLADRLYINDGVGNFKKDKKAIPEIRKSTSVVKPKDFDNDGDVDLFVGCRGIPGKYPMSDTSYVLINNGKGEFEKMVTPELDKLGMVTDAVWVDIDNDKKTELVVVGEFMPVTIFTWIKNRFSDSTSKFIDFQTNGLWNTLTTADIDNDGDMDLLIGNLGHNSQLKASKNEPVTLTYGDFDNNGFLDPVLCYFINGVSYPSASRDDLTDQMPFLKKKFLYYEDYSNATINDLFTKSQLEAAKTLKANTLSTLFLENINGRKLISRNLPLEVQYSPVYEIKVSDINKDGFLDILFLGNNSSTRVKFGRYCANPGMLLLGNGTGAFKLANQKECGLQIKQDVRCAELIKTNFGNKIAIGCNNSPLKIYKLR